MTIQRFDRPLPPSFALLLLMLPLVYVGTVRFGVRIVPADLLAVVVLAIAFVERRGVPEVAPPDHRWLATAAAALLVAGAAVSAMVGVMWVNPSHVPTLPTFDQLVVWQGTPAQRAIVEFSRTCVNAAALVATILIVRTPHRFKRAVTLFAAASGVTAAYAVYSWVSVVLGAEWPLLPNTFANPYTLRVAGTFPEPVAFSGYILTGIVATLWMMEHQSRRTPGVVLMVVQVAALLTAISAFGFLGAAVLGAALLIQSPFRLGPRLMVPLLVGLIVLFVILPPRYIIQQTTQKLGSSTAASWQDRTGAWRAAARMWAAYPLFGVGPGQFAYNQAAFFPADIPARFRGARVNSPALELLSEGGAVAGAAMLIVFGCSLSAVHRIRSINGRSLALKRIGWSACALLAVFAAGYYSSRYTFLWVFIGLIIASERAIQRRPPGWQSV